MSEIIWDILEQNNRKDKEQDKLDRINAQEIVNEEIEYSKIKRYPWKRLLGIVLTKYVIYLYLEGFSLQEIKDKVFNDKEINTFIQNNQKEKENIVKNINITISSQFCEIKNMEEEQSNKLTKRKND